MHVHKIKVSHNPTINWLLEIQGSISINSVDAQTTLLLPTTELMHLSLQIEESGITINPPLTITLKRPQTQRLHDQSRIAGYQRLITMQTLRRLISRPQPNQIVQTT